MADEAHTASGPPTGAVPDANARARIANDTAATLFVEAGAGSGKTTALVSRVLALVRSGEAPLANIAAITFTEKAATELADRIRAELHKVVNQPAAPAEAARCKEALAQLDSAAIGTLHAFAQRLLSAHPIEAGLPPRVEVADEVASAVAFEDRWVAFRDELLSDDELARPLLLLFSTGARHEALRALAVAFNQNWDLVAERVPTAAAPPPPVAALACPALQDILSLCGATASCRREDDKLAQRLDAIAAYAHDVLDLAAGGDEFDLLEAISPGSGLERPSFKVGNVGRKGDWSLDVAELRNAVAAAAAALDAVTETVATAAAAVVATRLRAFTLAAADARRAEGKLEFHDLLVLARAMLRDPRHGAAVRTALAQRYQRLLLDEFQDTDPIQIELAVRIAAADPAGAAAGSAPWDEVAVAPGRLFFVGDPKQSIYRFRRADIATFLAARDRFGGADGLVALTVNFRTGPAVIAWVNHTFANLMAPAGDDAAPEAARPAYRALSPVRPGAPHGPAVSVIGRDPLEDVTADELREVEASAVAAAVGEIIEAGWAVRDGTDSAGEESWRPAQFGDITVLVPARTSLPFLEAALEEAGISYRAESASLVYATRAVRDLLMVARAVDDPTDSLRVVAALRTPLLGCGDDDLFRFKVEQNGHWDYLRPQPATVDASGQVAVGMAYLGALHAESPWLAPSELLGRIATDRRAFELGVAEGRPRDVWRRLRFVVDQARAWTEATGGTLRSYLTWVAQQTAEGARVAESVLPETDDDAVRIMTVHAAKGLEFPITILSGASTVPQARRAAAEVAFPPGSGAVGYRFGSKVVTPEFAAWAPLDEQMGLDERVRLLYVAATRARDHLVVSLYRRTRREAPRPGARTNAELLVEGMGLLLDSLPDAGPGPRAGSSGPLPRRGDRVARPPAPGRVLVPFEQWQADTAAALAAASKPTTVSATALTVEGGADTGAEPPLVGPAPTAPVVGPDPGLQKRPRDLDLPPWLKGRYGTAVGRSVHGVLQTIDLAAATDDAIAAAVAAQCEAEAITERAGDVAQLVRAALDAPTVREASRLPHWREVYLCAPLAGGRLLEGYVDLLVRQPDGLVVVDYKTAATSDPAELDDRVTIYRNQGAAYAAAVAATTGEAVARVTFVFLTPQGAIERDLPDLEAAVADVLAEVTAGSELLAAETFA